MASAFQFGAFQFGAFQMEGIAGEATITDTINFIQKPINCVLHGHQKYYAKGREYDVKPTRRAEKAAGVRTGVRRFGGQAPAFTVRTDKRGYD